MELSGQHEDLDQKKTFIAISKIVQSSWMQIQNSPIKSPKPYIGLNLNLVGVIVAKSRFRIASISLRKPKRNSWSLYFNFVFWCHLEGSVLCLFLAMVWIGVWSVVVAFTGHTYLLFCKIRSVLIS